MKRKTINILSILFLCLSIPEFSKAQSRFDDIDFLQLPQKTKENYDKDRISLGIQAGLNLSNFSKGGYDLRPCLSAGVMVDIPIHKNWSVRPGVMMNMKGGRNYIDHPYMHYDGTPLVAEEKYYFSPLYIDVPVMITYKYHTDIYSHIFVGVGPYISYGVGGRATVEFLGQDQKIDLYKEDEVVDFVTNTKSDIDLNYARFNWGLVMEAGYRYEGFQASVGYDLGFTTVSDCTQGVVYGSRSMKYTAPGMKHRVWKIAIAYFFDL